MIILKAISFNEPDYIALAKERGSVFNQPDWLKIYKEKLVVLGIFNKNNELIGGLNIYKFNKFGLSMIIVPPYSPSNALFYCNPAVSHHSKITFDKALHTAIHQYFKQEKTKIIITAFPTDVNDMQVYSWNSYKVIPNYTYQLALNASQDELFNALSSEKRKSIRKADSDKLQIELCTDYSIVFDLIQKTFNRKQKNINEELVKKILFGFASPANSFAFVAYLNNLPIACSFCVYHRGTCYYLFGGYDEVNKHHGAGPAAMWQSILHAKKLQLMMFDFEGSMLPEVERYFREFGGKLVPYYTLNKAWLPIEVLLKVKLPSRF